MTILRLILGDQLSPAISSLSDCNKSDDMILMAEVMEEATYVKHHKKKIAFLFSAMRHFAAGMEEKGYKVAYTKLTDKDNAGSLKGEVERAVKKYQPEKVVVTAPGEYRLLEDMKGWEKDLEIDTEIREDDRFLCGIEDFKDWAKDRKTLRMEYFYREMRKKHDILMKSGDPVGGKWNYDAENRKSPEEDMDIPGPIAFQADDITQDVLKMVAEKFEDHFGDLEPFHFAVTRKEALRVLNRFIDERLPQFGDYQDAMKQGEPWMYHSHISFYLNCGLLSPIEAIRKAEEACESGDAPLNAVEGFVRQIAGWREFIRGIYWLHMPEYASKNALQARRKLPEFFWTAETQMNCLRQCITETKNNAYAHHIQRLMVLGNFLLLAGIDPKEVNEWYLIVYADAYEWVEMPNVTGMILYADDGVFASKPYAASGSYINKMSDYCKNCTYKVSKKNGPEACPFNYLYWDFMIRNKDRLKGNPRLNMPYKSLERMSEEKVEAVKEDARRFLKSL